MEVRVVNVRKEFERFAALHDVSLDIRSGELIALLGPSGSGKTTLLRLIAGLERPTSGAILFGEEDASQKTVQERNVGFVFQHYALFRHMTVLDNIGFGLKVRKKGRPSDAEIRKRAAELLDLVQLSGLEKRYPAQLSGGQRQRVAIGRAIVREPAAFLFDEPLPNLDAALRVTMRHEITGRHQKLKTTMIYVTHDQVEAMTMADKIVLHAGRIEQVGSPLELYNAPANIFVAGFHWQPEDEPRHRSRGGETRCPYHRRPPRASGDRGRGRLAGQGASGRASGLGHLPQGGQSRAGRADRPRQRRVRAESW